MPTLNGFNANTSTQLRLRSHPGGKYMAVITDAK